MVERVRQGARAGRCRKPHRTGSFRNENLRKAEEAGTSVTESHGRVQLVNKVFQGNAEILAGSRPEQGTGETGAVEGGRPPTGGPVRPDRKEHRSSRVTRSFGPRSVTEKTEYVLCAHIILQKPKCVLVFLLSSLPVSRPPCTTAGS